MQNHFELFQLAPQFDIDLVSLDQAFREVQAQVHPDKFVSASSAEQRVAMQWATRANEAYQTLKNPLKRATYLCEINGVNVQAESNTAMPAAFLMQQMEWREELDESRNDNAALDELERNVAKARKEQLEHIAQQFSQADYHHAAKSIRQLMFLEKFSEDVANAQD